MDWRTGVGLGLGIALAPLLTEWVIKRPAQAITNFLWKRLPEKSIWRKLLLPKPVSYSSRQTTQGIENKSP